jgi:hypothetical protein
VSSALQKLAIVLVSLALLGGGATLALAAKGGNTKGNAATTQYKAKCNSGRGNGSEIVNGVDCDPGNSGGHNKGGD